MFSHLRVVLRCGQNVAVKNQMRRMANWHRPNFLGGKAEPHEIGKLIRQRLYREGDIIFYIAGTFVSFFAIMGIVYFCDEKMAAYKKRTEDYVKFAHYNAYPYPTRVDDET